MRRIAALMAAAAFAFTAPAYADEPAPASSEARQSEMDALKKRIERLEDSARAASKEAPHVEEAGHKLHPMHSLYGIRITGSATMTAQYASHMKSVKSRPAFALSGDLSFESPVDKDGTAVAVLDYQRGTGLTTIPALFTGPNANPTGPNADVESFGGGAAPTAVHMTQLYYEHKLSDSLVMTVGQLDITGYFDANAFANNERTQFMANVFVNNPAIEFGGSDNFYGPGLRATWSPVEGIDLTGGAFEGDGDYANSFGNPFLMAEADFKITAGGRDGNYRIYYWKRNGRADALSTANPADPGLARAENHGVGISLDQMLTDNLGVWLRAGAQQQRVAQFHKAVSGGIHLGGAAFGRPNDAMGIGAAATYMGGVYRETTSTAPSFRPERYFEAYYSFSIGGATEDMGLHITPDIQYIVNAGGDRSADKPLIYGVRLQAFF